MAKKNTALHEMLAVEQDAKAGAERARAACLENFRGKVGHFTGIRRTFRPYEVAEGEEGKAGERIEAETSLAKTVVEELNGLLASSVKALDIGFQIDEANTRATADVIVDDVVLLKDVPATFLLQLEKRLKELRSVFKEIPTFDPVRIWSVDPGADKKHVLRAEAVTTIRKQKTRKYNVMVEATKEHPAQVDVVEVDEPVGEIKSYEWTGLISQGRKAETAEQIEKLIAAVKQARSRANGTVIDSKKKVGQVLVDFLMQPLQ